jgi:outer membrane cobalamin receptor
LDDRGLAELAPITPQTEEPLLTREAPGMHHEPGRFPGGGMRSPLLRVSSLAAAILVSAACAHPKASEQAPAPSAGTSTRLVTEEQIQRSGASTAWEALQYTVPFYRFDYTGRVGHRGQSSIVLTDQPRILLDGVDLTEFGVLMQMPATDLYSIKVLEGTDATTYYGTNAGSGVILIATKHSIDRN